MPPTPLNPAQRSAVSHMEGPLLVLAGPGSGKTRVVTHRIARLLKKGVEPTQILAVTFTNKAAREMRERVEKLVGKGAKKLTIATFHSACCRILREEIEPLGYGRNFSIYDANDQQSLMRTVLRDIAGTGASKSAATVLWEVGAVKAAGARNDVPRDPDAGHPDAGHPDAGHPDAGHPDAGHPDAGHPEAGHPDAGHPDAGHPEAGHPEAGHSDAGPDPRLPLAAQERALFVAHAGRRYQEELKARNAIDFDDILLLTRRLMREHPEARDRWRKRFQYLLVDEYQDTNTPQDDILTLLASEHRNLCVVGDDDQSIYGWRGAELDLILNFAKRWPGATVVRLEQNYRSTARIVRAASAVIAKNPKRHAKTLFTKRVPGDPVRVVELADEEQEAEYIAAEIRRAATRHGEKDSEGRINMWEATRPYAVLFRTNEQMRPREQALRQANLPYRLLGGRSFFDRKEVIDTLAYLKLAVNPDDEEALLRVINTPTRGLGARAIQLLSEHARAASSSLWDALSAVVHYHERPAGLSPQAVEGVRRFVASLETVNAAGNPGGKTPPPTTLVIDLLQDIAYKEEIERTYKDPKVQATRWNLAKEVNKAWEAYLAEARAPSLSGFLDGIALSGRDDDRADGTGVTLATIHASKGLEFPEVFIAGLEEGIFPHKRSVDDGRELAEERRVLFVALTRAQNRLTLTRAIERTARGKTVKTIPSRFLADLPSDELEAVDPNAPASDAVASSHLERMRALLGS